ncbi:MAG: hypothetical protein JWO19_3424 [Bryobacterales bacterium]|nr:hypothetical protein [Bryobacterales bacterium]
MLRGMGRGREPVSVGGVEIHGRCLKSLGLKSMRHVAGMGHLPPEAEKLVRYWEPLDPEQFLKIETTFRAWERHPGTGRRYIRLKSTKYSVLDRRPRIKLAA